jgi:hypothetical protein
MFKLNRLISEYRIKVEHAICELKCYKVMGTLWRHPRLLGIYGKCMTQTKRMNHTYIHTGIKKTYIKTCIYLIVEQ